MRTLLVVMLISLLSVPQLSADSHAGNARAAADRLIEEFGLREDSRAMRDYPNWNPQRVVVSLPPWLTARWPDMEQRLRAVAGNTELVIDRSPGFRPTAEQLAGADALIGLCQPATLAHASDGFLWLHNYYVGMDRCAGLTDADIEGRVFSNSKRLSAPTIAEHGIAMLTSLARGLPAYQRAQSAARWDREVAQTVTFGELAGKTVLVVGLGGIGSQFAWRAHGMGMTVLATRNSSREGPDYVDYVGLSPELPELVARADVIVNALPLTAQTTGLFDEALFKQFKPGGIYINLGRGKTTDTDALTAALASGQLYGAGLDVTDPEPLPADHPLWAQGNVIITPHTSSAGGNSEERLAVITVENLRRYVAGEPLLNIVNMRAGY